MTRRLLLEVAALGVVLVALVLAVLFRVTGGHWESVESPSMGTTAPVGTLLWVRPVRAGDLQVGDVVSFHRPETGGAGAVYSHRVRAVHEDSSFETRGDLSGDDLWVVQPDDLVGRVTWIWPGVGRLIQAAPVLVVGGLLTVLGVRLVRRGGRLPLAILGTAFTLTAAIVWFEPLAGAQQLSAEPLDGGGERIAFVSTGLLPIEVSARDATPIRLTLGEEGAVETRAFVDRELRVDLRPVVPLWFWVLLGVGCLAPAAVSTLVGRHPRVR